MLCVCLQCLARKLNLSINLSIHSDSQEDQQWTCRLMLTQCTDALANVPSQGTFICCTFYLMLQFTEAKRANDEETKGKRRTRDRHPADAASGDAHIKWLPGPSSNRINRQEEHLYGDCASHNSKCCWSCSLSVPWWVRGQLWAVKANLQIDISIRVSQAQDKWLSKGKWLFLYCFHILSSDIAEREQTTNKLPFLLILPNWPHCYRRLLGDLNTVDRLC